jgi:uncharacterized membrane-anchored protein
MMDPCERETACGFLSNVSRMCGPCQRDMLQYYHVDDLYLDIKASGKANDDEHAKELAQFLVECGWVNKPAFDNAVAQGHEAYQRLLEELA